MENTFKWDTNLYDQKHDFVSRYGQDLLEYLQPQSGEKILDLGCGTGDLTNMIAWAGATVVGVDNSKEMIDVARQKYPSIEFLQMDARELKLPSTFDSIFSNAVLHWIPEKDVVIRKMSAHLKKEGKLVLEFGGKGNNQTMLNALRSTLRARGYHKNAEINFWYYPSIGEYACELEKQNFRALRAEHFDRFTELKGEEGLKDWFIMFAERFFKDISPKEKSEILDTIQNNLRATHYVNGKWYADYKRIRIVAVKE